MATQSWLLAEKRSTGEDCSIGHVVAKKHLSDNSVAIKFGSQDGKYKGQFIADILRIRLSIEGLIEGGQTITGGEAVVDDGIESRIWSSDILGKLWCNKHVIGITIRWDLDSSFASSGPKGTGCAQVWILI